MGHLRRLRPVRRPRRDIKLTRADGSPGFERSYTGRHYISMGWLNWPPSQLERMGAFTATYELADRTLKQFIHDLNAGGPGQLPPTRTAAGVK